MSIMRWQVFIALACVAVVVLAGCQPTPAAAPKETPAAKQEAPKAAAPEAPKAAAPKEQAAAKPAEAKSADGAPIRIGVLVPRTGVLAFYGEGAQRAVELFIDELNAQGGVSGRKLEAIYRDSKTQPDEAVRQTRDLLLSEKVDFLVHSTNSGECLGIGEVAKEAKKIVFSSCGVDDFTSAKGHRYTFRIPNITTRTQGEAAAKYAADNLKDFKTVYTIAHDYAAGRSIVEFFTRKLKSLKSDAQFIGETWPKLTETDYTPYLTAVQSAKADVTMYFFAGAIPFFNQAVPVSLHKQTTLLSAYWGGVDEVATLKQEQVPEGAIMGGFPWYSINNPSNKQFVDKYRARTNQPPRGSSYFEYTTMQFLVEAIKRTGTTDTEKVVDALEGMELDTVVGKVRIRPFDHQGATPHWVGRAKWDADLKLGVVSDLVQLQSEEFLPTEAEIKTMRGQ